MSGSTSYRVHADLQLRSNATAVLNQVSRALGGLSARLQSVQARTNRVVAALGGLAAGLGPARQMAFAMQSLQAGTTAASQAVQGATRAIGSQATALGRAAQSANQATAALRALSAAQTTARAAGPVVIQRGGVSGRAGGTLGTLGTMEASGQIGRQALRGVGTTLTDAGALQQAETVIRSQGFTGQEQEDVRAASRRLVRQVPGVTLTEAVNAIAEARTTVGSVAGAIAFAPDVLRTGRVASTFTGQPSEDAARPLVRALGLRGAFTGPTGELDEQRGRGELQAMMRTIIAFRGAFEPRELLNFMQQAGVAGKEISIEALSGPMASLIQEMRGHRAGTALAAFRRQTVGGVMTKAQLAEWRRVGLIGTGVRATDVSEADIVGMRRRNEISEEEAATLQTGRADLTRIALPTAQRDLARMRPDLWFEQVFKPMARRVGAVTEEQMVDLAGRLFGVETARRFAVQMLQTREVREDIEATRRVAPNAVDIILNEGWTNALANLGAGFTNLLTQVGEATAGGLIPFMNQLAGALNTLGGWAREHPQLTQWLVGIGAGIGVLAVATAGAAAIGLALQGLAAGLAVLAAASGGAALAASLVAIGAAIGIMTGHVQVSDLPVSLQSAGQAIRDFGLRIGGFVDSFVGFIERLDAALQRIGAAIGRGLTFGTFDNIPTQERALGSAGSREQQRREELLRQGRPVDPDAPVAVPNSFQPVPPNAATEGLTPILLYLDGREVGRGVLPHIGRDAAGPIQATARFDGSRALRSPAATYAA